MDDPDGDVEDVSPPKAKVVIGFDANGFIVRNRNQLQKATRELLYSQFSVGLDSWNDVDADARTDLWSTLKCDFEMDDIHKDTVMAMMGIQLKSYRNRIRMRELKDLPARDILKRMNDPPADIQLTAWNKFIEREATDAKMKERLKNADNRAHNEDIHCLGKKSYAQLSAELAEKGIEHDRPYVYTYARTQADGSIFPSAVENVRKLKECQRTQDPIDQHNIQKDALARAKGPDNNGRIRAVSSRMSKFKYIGIQTVKNFMKRKGSEAVDDDIRRKNEERYNEILRRLDKIEGQRSTGTGSSCSTMISHSSPSIPLGTSSAATQRPSSSSIPVGASSEVPCSQSTIMYRICSTVSFDCVAVGTAVVPQLVGEIVHGTRVNDNEKKVNVMMVYPGKEGDPLYKGMQASAFTIGEMVGNYLIWPSILLQPM